MWVHKSVRYCCIRNVLSTFLNCSGRYVNVSPVCHSQMSYFAFLVLYGVILLTDFYPIHIKAIDAKEIVLIIWIGTFIFEEIRQVDSFQMLIK